MFAPGFLLALSNSLAASIVVKATVTVALGLAAAWLARRSPAAVRHTLLAAAFGVLLVLPIVALIAPPLRIAVAARERMVPAASRDTGVISSRRRRQAWASLPQIRDRPDSRCPSSCSRDGLPAWRLLYCRRRWVCGKFDACAGVLCRGVVHNP